MQSDLGIVVVAVPIVVDLAAGGCWWSLVQWWPVTAAGNVHAAREARGPRSVVDVHGSGAQEIHSQKMLVVELSLL